MSYKLAIFESFKWAFLNNSYYCISSFHPYTYTIWICLLVFWGALRSIFRVFRLNKDHLRVASGSPACLSSSNWTFYITLLLHSWIYILEPACRLTLRLNNTGRDKCNLRVFACTDWCSFIRQIVRFHEIQVIL